MEADGVSDTPSNGRKSGARRSLRTRVRQTGGERGEVPRQRERGSEGAKNALRGRFPNPEFIPCLDDSGFEV